MEFRTMEGGGNGCTQRFDSEPTDFVGENGNGFAVEGIFVETGNMSNGPL